jgi:hypothetical protein
LLTLKHIGAAIIAYASAGVIVIDTADARRGSASGMRASGLGGGGLHAGGLHAGGFAGGGALRTGAGSAVMLLHIAALAAALVTIVAVLLT